MSDYLRAELEAMRAREQAATPGPWEVRRGDPQMDGSNWTLRQAGVPGIRLSVHEYGHGTGNAEFIAHSRADMGRLLDAVEAIEALLSKDRSHIPTAYIRAALSEHLGGRRKILDDLSREGYANSPHGEGFDEHLGGRDE